MSQIWLPAQLAMLAKVVDLNGFSSAARTLGVPKASVSRAIADLEQTLGVTLLIRTTRRLSLTAAGRLLYPYARSIAEECDGVRAVIAKLHSPAVGPLRIVCDSIYGRVLLTPLVPRFLECFPDIPLEVALEGTMREQSADVVIQAHLPDEPGSAHRLLGAPPALLCATPAYLARRGMPARPEDLCVHDLLTPEPEGPPEFRLLLTRGAQRAEVNVSPKLAVSDPAVRHAATAAGLGIGLLPAFLCRQGLATGRLEAVLAQWTAPPAVTLYALYPQSLAADDRVARFVEFLAANIVPALEQG